MGIAPVVQPLNALRTLPLLLLLLTVQVTWFTASADAEVGQCRLLAVIERLRG
jgi:hypothetical protein